MIEEKYYKSILHQVGKRFKKSLIYGNGDAGRKIASILANSTFTINKKQTICIVIKNNLINLIQKKRAIIGIFGLGYIGLPKAIQLHAGYKVVGFDNDIKSKEIKQKEFLT